MRNKVFSFRKLFLIFVLLIMFLLSDPPFLLAFEKEIKGLSSTMAESIAKAGKKTIAVVDFVDLQGNVTELGRFLAEELSIALAREDKGFEVVERTHLKTLLKEHKLSETGMIDPSTAKKLGQIAGVDALVTGTTADLRDIVRLSVKILVTDTAKIIGASSCDIPKTKAIEELLVRDVGEREPSELGPKTVRKVKIADYTFELRQAKIEGDTVNCNILITNNAAEDRILYLFVTSLFWSGSFVVDDLGNHYEVTEILLGTRSSRHYDSVSQLLVSGVPTNARVFSKISPGAKKIALLEIVGSGEEYGRRFKVQFRDIPLSR